MMSLLVITPEVDKNHDTRGFIHEWLKALSQRVDELNVVTMRQGKTELADNVKVYSFDHRTSRLISLFRFYKIIFKIFRNKEINAVFVHMIPNLAIMAAPLCWLCRKPVILWREHGSVSLISKLAFYFVDKIVSASENGFGNFKPGHPKKLVVGHGIDTDFFVPDPLSRPREAGEAILTRHCEPRRGEAIPIKLLSVGRISPSKDYETVIRALPEIMKNIKKPVRYAIIGQPFSNTPRDDFYFEKLKRLTRDLSLENVVIFMGAAPNKDVVPYYQQCDIFINPSLTGSLDKTGLEAMACGKPAMSCNESYLPIFGNYRDELFFEPKNNSGLADKLVKLIGKSNEYWKTMGADLRREVVANHNLNNLMDKLVVIFNNEIKH